MVQIVPIIHKFAVPNLRIFLLQDDFWMFLNARITFLSSIIWMRFFFSLMRSSQTILTGSNICLLCWNAKEGYDAERDGLNKALFKNVRNDMPEWIQLHCTKARLWSIIQTFLGSRGRASPSGRMPQRLFVCSYKERST